jgi:hypothetical protein
MSHGHQSDGRGREIVASSSGSDKILGYLNFSDGRQDVRWQQMVCDSFASHSDADRPWLTVPHQWISDLKILQEAGAAGFRDSTQASIVLRTFIDVLPAYQSFHSELLGHCSDRDLFAPLFLVRVLESVLRQVHKHESLVSKPVPPTLVSAVVRDLNDFVGYRPVALLETRLSGEAYGHEKHRPVPVYLRGLGAGVGRFSAVVSRAFEFLGSTSGRLLEDAGLDLSQIDELAVDMRSYDHGHPANLRPNQVFGEWDPARVDGKGRFSRIVVRHLIMEAIAEWQRIRRDDYDPDEAISEGAAVLSGTMLMASGVTGGGPGAHDSSKRLGDLLPGIAKYRDQFYRTLQDRLPQAHQARLAKEEKQVRQPFGRVRQFLNTWMARQRAHQVQQQALATLFARLGLPGCSTVESRRIQVLAPRFMSDILSRMKLLRFEGELGRLDAAVGRLPDLVQRVKQGIQCGALTDPWNVLGFQGMFPLSPAREDAVRDSRLDDLLSLVERLFESMTFLWAECAAKGDDDRASSVSEQMRELAQWWDPFATYRVSDVRAVKGSRHFKAGRGVADALSRWRQRGSAPADMVFWQRQVKYLKTAQTHALAVETLLRQGDLSGAQGLLVHWISVADEIGLEDGQHGFQRLAFQWLNQATQFPLGDSAAEDVRESRVKRLAHFLSQLTVNAGDLLEVPSLNDLLDGAPGSDREADLGSEGFSTQQEPGGLADEALPDSPFDMEDQIDSLESRLRFQASHGRLIQEGARWLEGEPVNSRSLEQIVTWRDEACDRSGRLLRLAEQMHSLEVPGPSSAEVDAFLQFERRRSLRESLTHEALIASLEQRMAGLVLALALQSHKQSVQAESGDPAYLKSFVDVGCALFNRDQQQVRTSLAEFSAIFRDEPLLHTHLFQGGRPANLLRTRMAMQVLRVLLANLPRLGLFADTLELLKLTRRMEDRPGPDGPGVTEFVHYFSAGLQATVEAVIHSSTAWENSFPSPGTLTGILDKLIRPFEALWIEHSRSGQLSALEGIGNEKDYRAMQGFVKEHGRELFHARFMTLANLRGILHRGPRAYLESLAVDNDPLRKSKLADKLQSADFLATSSRWLEVILKTLVENYEEFKDYNTTTTLSDYGENLNILIDFLVLKSGYERRAWELRPHVLVHEVLARQERQEEARVWQEALEERTRVSAEDQVNRLAQLEKLHGARLGTIRDRIEERFVKNLGLDRLCALIRPVLEQSRAYAGQRPRGVDSSSMAEEEGCPALGLLRTGLGPFTERPAGVGRDIPEWIRKLELELQRVGASNLVTVVSPEHFFRLAPPRLSGEDVIREIESMSKLDAGNPDIPLAT